MSDRDLRVSTSRSGPAAVLELRGSLVFGSAEDQLVHLVRQLLAGGARAVALDMSGLTFVDSSGLGALLRCHGLAEETGGELLLRGVSDRVRGLLEVAGLDEQLNVEP